MLNKKEKLKKKDYSKCQRMIKKKWDNKINKILNYLNKLFKKEVDKKYYKHRNNKVIKMIVMNNLIY